jgi:hypothetical protein
MQSQTVPCTASIALFSRPLAKTEVSRSYRFFVMLDGARLTATEERTRFKHEKNRFRLYHRTVVSLARGLVGSLNLFRAISSLLTTACARGWFEVSYRHSES